MSENKNTKGSSSSNKLSKSSNNISLVDTIESLFNEIKEYIAQVVSKASNAEK